jgi:SAM-dependent methyltransferase
MSAAELPGPELLRRQAQWLAPARSRLLRRVEIARRRRVLDLGCGRGTVSGELSRRSGGLVVAADRLFDALRDDVAPFGRAARIAADAARLPLADESFDLVFCQMTLLWMDAAGAAAEAFRVLRPGGALVALEPDFGGLIEHPAELAARELWLAALGRTGADPLVGRKLPGLLRAAGFHVRVDLFDRLEPPAARRFELLGGLPLLPEESERLARLKAADAATPEAEKVVHLPVFLVTAEKGTSRVPL